MKVGIIGAMASEVALLKEQLSEAQVTRVPDKDAGKALDDAERQLAIEHLEERMLEAANNLDFEKAAKLRDQMLQLRGERPMSSGEQSRQKRRKRAKA